MDRLYHVLKITASCKRSEARLGSSFVGCSQGIGIVTLLHVLSLYINDISTYIESDIRLFADDRVCYREIKEKKDTLKPDID